ncbi:hypothetical protein BSFA1_53030 [Burkholderia sp. SFA1]|uniref:hypothetical protein n=1 Tax=Caballeronia sp. CLC5 TaxID=2906764 RepID=UPI001F1AE38C|nr:hypothetical protein [Caballeronia sp. CLC5]MCE4574790.1 hypothetical protein [Caballeronia sp. CLC5]BBQ00175.1 hypothetical protein BSFA1_53030 [Burkholderia sp. SFA1]
MWQSMKQRLDEVVAEAATLPDSSDAIRDAKQHIAQLPAGAANLLQLQARVLDHVANAKGSTARALLAATVESPDMKQQLATYANTMKVDVDAIISDIQEAGTRISRRRAVMGEDAARLSAVAMDARARLKVLEQRREELDVKARELRDRSVWTWLFLPAKAIDELVSAIQHGKSTEAALEDALRQIGDAQREASGHIRSYDICTNLSETLKQLAAGIQSVANKLEYLKGYMSSQESMASLAAASSAQVCLKTVLGLLSVIETEAA